MHTFNPFKKRGTFCQLILHTNNTLTARIAPDINLMHNTLALYIKEGEL